jgi:hypothetical protein
VSETRITNVYQIAQRHCLARINCRHCDHSIVLSGVILERMTGPFERLDNAEKRLRCTRCMGKGARIAIVRPPSR